MRRLLRAAASLMAFAVLLAVPGAATADANRTRPFSGSVIGTDAMGAPCSGPGSWLYTSSGTGHLAHVGVVTYTVSHCSRMTGATTGTFGSGGTVFTSRSGDKLYMDHWGTFSLVMGDTGPVGSMVDLRWRITDGTGRFLHATGEGTGEGYSDLAVGTTQVDFDGVIKYDPSHRR
jgi:hypothetical protein